MLFELVAGMTKVYSARDYLRAFEPWLLEDVGALAGILADDTRRAEKAPDRLMIPRNPEGRYCVEVWLVVHPLVTKSTSVESVSGMPWNKA